MNRKIKLNNFVPFIRVIRHLFEEKMNKNIYLLLVVTIISSCAMKKEKIEVAVAPERKIRWEISLMLDEIYNTFKTENPQSSDPVALILDFRKFDTKDTTLLSKVVTSTFQNIIVGEKQSFKLVDDISRSKLYADETLNVSHQDKYDVPLLEKISKLTNATLIVDGYIKEEMDGGKRYILIITNYFDNKGKLVREISLPKIENSTLISQIDPYQTLKMVFRKKEAIKEGRITIVFKTEIDDGTESAIRETISKSITSEDFTHEYEILSKKMRSENLPTPQKIIVQLDDKSYAKGGEYFENSEIEETNGLLIERNLASGWHKVEISYDIAHKESECDPISEIVQVSKKCWINILDGEESNILIYNKISKDEKPHAEVRFLSKIGKAELKEKECFPEKNLIK